jgi:hypothetical protein
MEEQNKYYTPDISELHVGYTCQLYGQATTRLMRDVQWFNFTFTCGNINRAEKLINRKDIRTKYLDQSDIESLGWEFDKSRGIPLEYHYTKEVNLKKYKLTKLSTKIHIGILQQGNTLYEGECKSINELRKTMEWLNIK